MFFGKTKKRLGRIEEDLTGLSEKTNDIKAELSDIEKKMIASSAYAERLATDVLGIERKLEEEKEVNLAQTERLAAGVREIKIGFEEEEKKNKAELLEYIRKQDLILEQISKKVDSLSNMLAAIPLSKPELSPKPESGSKPVSKPGGGAPANVPLFTGNHGHNIQALMKLIDRVSDLESSYAEILGSDPNNKIYFKIIDAYKTELTELADEVKDDEMEAEEIADKLSGILRSYLFKNFANPALATVIDTYLRNCKLGKYEIKVNQLITDDMYAYIGEPLITKVGDPQLDKMILSKKHDAYFILYQDENGIRKKIITGECEVGRYS